MTNSVPNQSVDTEKLRKFSAYWDELGTKFQSTSMKGGDVSLSIPQMGVFALLQSNYTNSMLTILKLFQDAAVQFHRMSTGLGGAATKYDHREGENALSLSQSMVQDLSAWGEQHGR